MEEEKNKGAAMAASTPPGEVASPRIGVRATGPKSEAPRADLGARPLIFLDFDGVLNSRDYFASCGGQPHLMLHNTLPEGIDARWLDIDPLAVRRLNRIVEATGAAVVVSSTWRLGFKFAADLRGGLAARGFVGDIVGKTPVDEHHYRGREIRRFLSAWREPDAPFVVLDDDSDMDGVREQFIHVDGVHGLQDAHVARAITMLGLRPATTTAAPKADPAAPSTDAALTAKENDMG